MDLNRHSPEEGLSKDTLHGAANPDIPMLFLMGLEKPENMWGLLGQMEKTRHNIIHRIQTQLSADFKTAREKSLEGNRPKWLKQRDFPHL